MIAVDTNILVYAHRSDSEWHERARNVLAGLAASAGVWAIPWQCVHELLAVVTNARIFADPTPVPVAVGQIQEWMRHPRLRLLGETPEHWSRLVAILESGRVSGAMVHDACIAAVCVEHGIEELWTADRDYGRMPGLRVRNPLL